MSSIPKKTEYYPCFCHLVCSTYKNTHADSTERGPELGFEPKTWRETSLVKTGCCCTYEQLDVNSLQRIWTLISCFCSHQRDVFRISVPNKNLPGPPKVAATVAAARGEL